MVHSHPLHLSQQSASGKGGSQQEGGGKGGCSRREGGGGLQQEGGGLQQEGLQQEGGGIAAGGRGDHRCNWCLFVPLQRWGGYGRAVGEASGHDSILAAAQCQLGAQDTGAAVSDHGIDVAS